MGSLFLLLNPGDYKMSAASFGFGVSGAVLNFAGGLFLIIDSIRVRNKVLAQAGADEVAKYEAKRAKKGKKPLYTDGTGKPLATEVQWALWLANRALTRTWIGFLLISVGFFLDFISRMLNPNG